LNFKNLITRSLTGAVFVAAVLGSIFLGESVFIGLFSVFTIVGTMELYRIASFDNKIEVSRSSGLILSGYVFMIFAFVGVRLFPGYLLLTIPPAVLVVVIAELFRRKENPLLNIAVLILPLFYVAFPFSVTAYIFRLEVESPEVLLAGFFLLIWTNDTFAYLTGVTIGKHRLFERISPKKSWEGFFGGVIFSMIIAYVLGGYFDVLERWQWSVMALIVSVAGTFGDLTESMFKRSAGIKDSGKMLPGHGGVLDRFDGVLMAAPFVVVYLYLIL